MSNGQSLRGNKIRYSKWLKLQGKPYKYEALLTLIRQFLEKDDENGDNYGVRRIFIALRNNKSYTGRYSTVCRVCRENGITLPKNRKLSDITEVPCSDGKLYVSPVLDCFDGVIVGLTMDDNMRKELCISSSEQACHHQNAYGMIFHSDRGSQYTSGDFRAALASMVQSRACPARADVMKGSLLT